MEAFFSPQTLPPLDNFTTPLSSFFAKKATLQKNKKNAT